MDDPLKPLLARLRDPDEAVRTETAAALGATGDRNATPYLIGALSDPSEQVQLAAAEALGLLREPQSVPMMIRVFREASPPVQVVLAQTLARIGDQAAIPALMEAVMQDDPQVRMAAADALRQLREASGAGLPTLMGSTSEPSTVTPAASAAPTREGLLGEILPVVTSTWGCITLSVLMGGVMCFLIFAMIVTLVPPVLTPTPPAPTEEPSASSDINYVALAGEDLVPSLAVNSPDPPVLVIAQ